MNTRTRINVLSTTLTLAARRLAMCRLAAVRLTALRLSAAFVFAIALTGGAARASAATISISTPGVVSGPFDVGVSVTDLFTGRTPDDVLFSFGFNVNVSDPGVLSFTGATAGSMFDAVTPQAATNVFAAAIGQNGFGVEFGAAEPLILATLHFNTVGLGPASIFLTSDLGNAFQGLQFFNAPFAEAISGSTPVRVAAPVPEPATLLLSGAGLLAVGFLRRRQR